jgi:UV excision repair protein RAD23
LKGQIVVDDKKLEDYNIKDGDLMVLMLVKKPNVDLKKEEKPQAVEPKQEQPKPVNTNVNNLVMGENYNKAVDDICNMGFPREDVVKAMQAAFNNPDRAIEYLINGIPVNVPLQENPAAMGNEELNQPIPGPGQPLPNANNINQLRQAIQNDPNFLQNMMSTLATSNPQLFQAINSNPEEFLRLLQEEGGNENEDLLDEEEGVEIPLSEDDQKAIDRLCALGFDKQSVIEAYLSCEKNEEMAANLLFDNGNNFGDPQGH